MARIRTVKPEFWGHPLLGRMSDTTRLMAIALLNLADDDGYFLADPALVRNFARPYDTDSGSTTVALRELSGIGYLEVREHSTHGAIGVIPTFRKHQQINKPTKSKLIQYFEEASRSPPVALPYDSREEGKGREGNGSGKGMEIPPPPKAAAPVTAPAWSGYSTAYSARYKAQPVRNATVNGQLSQLVKRLGAEEAPDVAAWYVGHNGARYVAAGHSVGLLLADAEKLRTEWATGRQITTSQARQVDKTQGNLNNWASLLRPVVGS